ncbi:XVIPCD domain-containing protein [Xanthomonas cassavae]|uniref:XVIPCD domain-containing protein n=1 Tax=Xanthomonas cassavae TaxID=56450 RepID=UPI001268E396|nr:XVIPCD domain-containing protein [Xanthomonas cassavae]
MQDASLSGLTRIDHVTPNKAGDGLFIVEGRRDDPAHRRAYVDRDQAAQQTLEQSTQRLQQDLAIGVDQAPARETNRAMAM